MGWLLAVNPGSVVRRRIRGKRRKEEEEKGEEEGVSKSLISSGWLPRLDSSPALLQILALCVAQKTRA